MNMFTCYCLAPAFFQAGTHLLLCVGRGLGVLMNVLKFFRVFCTNQQVRLGKESKWLQCRR
jgi:hypothetical protein